MGEPVVTGHNARPSAMGSAWNRPKIMMTGKTESMNTLFRIIRWPLGQAVIFIDWITRPRILERSPARRAELEALTSGLKLYQFKQCPFCVKTRRTIRRLGLNIELRDARNDATWNQELIQQGGRYQVPCLRLVSDDGSSQWLYESKEIINYLNQHFS
jgi:glutaredoxin